MKMEEGEVVMVRWKGYWWEDNKESTWNKDFPLMPLLWLAERETMEGCVAFQLVPHFKECSLSIITLWIVSSFFGNFLWNISYFA